MMSDAIDFKRTKYLAVLDIGQRNTGKTFETLEWIDDYLSTRKSGRVLVFMTLDHKKYRKFREIKVNEIPAVQSGVARIISSDFERIFSYINARNYENTFLIFEDASSYLTESKLNPRIKQFLVDSKQKNLHLLFHFHAWGFVQPDFFRLIDFIRIHKTIDSPVSKKNYIGMYEEVDRIYQIVKRTPGPHYYSQDIRIGA